MGTPAPRGYDAIRALSKQCGITNPNLLALHRNNDPFFSGSPTDRQQAAWFVDQWRRAGATTGMHLRRMHYWTFSQRDVLLPAGAPHENSNHCWAYLQDGSKHARYLGLVAPEALIDQRNPEPQIFTAARLQPEPAVQVSPTYFALPTLDAQLDRGFLTAPHATISGYDYQEADQPYHLELWAEKTTMNDILVPLCRELGVTLVTGAGFLSITAIVSMLQKRAAPSGKPVRIFYISDFDRASFQMPVAVSRQSEFWINAYFPGGDVKLQPIVLTRSQVDEFDLPNQPSDTGHNAEFEARQERGVVELDALEALHSGELARIVRSTIEEYKDSAFEAQLAQAQRTAQRRVTEAWDTHSAEAHARLETVRHAAQPVIERYTAEQAELSRRFAADLAPYEADLQDARDAYDEAARTFAVTVPTRPEPEMVDDDAEPWLYDSNRDYFDQLAAYKQRQRGDQERIAS